MTQSCDIIYLLCLIWKGLSSNNNEDIIMKTFNFSNWKIGLDVWKKHYRQTGSLSSLPREAPQCNTAGASPWHPRNDPHPRSSLWHLHPPAPVKPPHLLDAKIKSGWPGYSEAPDMHDCFSILVQVMNNDSITSEIKDKTVKCTNIIVCQCWNAYMGGKDAPRDTVSHWLAFPDHLNSTLLTEITRTY